MVLRRVLLFLVLAGFAIPKTFAQSDDFCNAIVTIIGDAPNKFRNIRGNETRQSEKVIAWEAGIKVPGSIGARFVASMGLFYECAFFQSKNKEEVRSVYDKYRALLTTCLSAHGYTLSTQPNFYPGMADYKKLVFMIDLKDDSKGAPPHITLEATYSKQAGYYTIVMFIFEH